MHNKYHLLFGIVVLVLINILLISGAGLGSSLGGRINIPIGNQTVINVTSNHSQDIDNPDDVINFDDSEYNETTVHGDDGEDLKEESANASTSINSNATVTTNPNPSVPYNNIPGSSSSPNSNEGSKKSVGDIIKSFFNNNLDSNETKIDSADEKENPSSATNAGFDNGKDIKIILVLNTLCLFFAFVTLRNYTNEIEEQS